MNTLERDEEIMQAEKEMLKQFCERYASQMVRKSPEEIIEMWLDWQYQRFKFKEYETLFVIADCKEGITIATVNKEFPSAKRLCYEICDLCNNMHDVDAKETLLKILESLKGDKE